MKLIKALANLGHGSRRQVALMFREGRVTDAAGLSRRRSSASPAAQR